MLESVLKWSPVALMVCFVATFGYYKLFVKRGIPSRRRGGKQAHGRPGSRKSFRLALRTGKGAPCHVQLVWF